MHRRAMMAKQVGVFWVLGSDEKLANETSCHCDLADHASNSYLIV